MVGPTSAPQPAQIPQEQALLMRLSSKFISSHLIIRHSQNGMRLEASSMVVCRQLEAPLLVLTQLLAV